VFSHMEERWAGRGRREREERGEEGFFFFSFDVCHQLPDLCRGNASCSRTSIMRPPAALQRRSML